MKMNEVKSVTWSKMAEIPTDDFTDEEIAKAIAKAINKKVGEPFSEDILTAIADGYIQICDDGIIVWRS